jgi:hypothetical protein
MVWTKDGREWEQREKECEPSHTFLTNIFKQMACYMMLVIVIYFCDLGYITFVLNYVTKKINPYLVTIWRKKTLLVDFL